VWCDCWYHLRDFDLPPRYRSNTTFDPVGLVCGTRKSRSWKEATRHVADIDQNVQDRGWLLCPLPGYSPDSCWCCAIRKDILTFGSDHRADFYQVGLNFMVYESVREAFTPEGSDNPSSVGKLGAGAISGAIAQTCTYPL
jgi:hypothetical protein